MSGEFTELTGKKLGQAAVTATAAIVYETPANTRTYIKDIMVANTRVVHLMYKYILLQVGVQQLLLMLLYTTKQ